MALRLQYDDVAVVTVETNLIKALDQFIAQHPGKPKRIFCTYTAMLKLRAQLGTITSVEKVL